MRNAVDAVLSTLLHHVNEKETTQAMCSVKHGFVKVCLQCRWNAATGVVMSHEVARHVQHSAKLKALQRTPHHLIIARIKELLCHLRPRPAADAKAAEDQVSCLGCQLCLTHCLFAKQHGVKQQVF